jgi:hypothetical protein
MEKPSADYAIDLEDCGTSAVRRAGLQRGASKSERGDVNRNLPDTAGRAKNYDLLKVGGQNNDSLIC